MLKEHGVAGNEIGGKDAHNLIKGEIPRFDCKNNAGGLFQVIGFAGSGGDRHGAMNSLP